MAGRMAGRLTMVVAMVWLAEGQARAQAQPPTGGTVNQERLRLDSAIAGNLAGQPAPGPPSRRDSVLNGVLIGAGIGAALGLIPDYYDDCEECHDSLYWSIAAGAGVGLLVDLLRGGGGAGTGSQGPPSKHLRMGLLATADRVGVGGHIRWR